MKKEDKKWEGEVLIEEIARADTFYSLFIEKKK